MCILAKKSPEFGEQQTSERNENYGLLEVAHAVNMKKTDIKRDRLRSIKDRPE